MSDKQPGTVIVVGFTVPMMKALEEFQADGTVIFVDEPDVIRKRDHAPKVTSPVVAELMGFEYQLPAAADRFFQQHRDLSPVAVVPGLEYAVPFAARLAERYGVPGSGLGAAHILRDKSQLRQVSADAGITNPASARVDTLEQATEFVGTHGTPVILKPANRQAALGTIVVRAPEELSAAWAEAVQQDEGVFVPDRNDIPLQMLVEECVNGDEYSVEMVIGHGNPVFGNVTAKILYPGRRPIELGHVAPADISQELSLRLLTETERVAAAVGFDTGFLHCEWIVANDEPYLVECAGRMPGDGIIELIQHAWDFDVVEHYLAALRGGSLDEAPPETPAGRGAVWFLHVEPGDVVSIEGVEQAHEVPGVISADVVVHPGDRVNELRSSWDRVALATVVRPTAGEALDNAKEAIARISVKVQ